MENIEENTQTVEETSPPPSSEPSSALPEYVSDVEILTSSVFLERKAKIEAQIEAIAIRQQQAKADLELTDTQFRGFLQTLFIKYNIKDTDSVSLPAGTITRNAKLAPPA